jgi:tRNA dimethylallyltransferase
VAYKTYSGVSLWKSPSFPIVSGERVGVSQLSLIIITILFLKLKFIFRMTSTLIVLTGPTGIGKSYLALQLARHFKADIISADSRQMYKEMMIGTAVPSPEDLDRVRHHHLQTISIHDNYNAGKFETEVITLLGELFASMPVVIMAGGSMLYIDAVCKGIDDLPTVDPEVRESLVARFETEGLEALRLELKSLDPVYYRQVDLHNPKRLLHALEMCIMSGKPYSQLRTAPQKERPFHIIKIGLTAERQVIYGRINRRVDQMVAMGLEEEARSLYPFRSCNALNTVGYKEWFDYFDGKTGKDKTIENIKSNSRRYARKQLTWFRKDPDMHWFDIHETEKVIPFIEEQMEEIKRNKEIHRNK